MKKLFTFTLILLLSPLPALASFGSATQWDVRTTGSNTNGGAFDPGVTSPGTDESRGSGTAVTITLASSTTGTSSPAFTSTTHGPGNFVNITGGTGCTTGWHELLSQASGTGTFDSSMGSASDVCTGILGGSMLTIQAADALTVCSNTVNIQSGTYTLTSTYALHLTTCAITWSGYQTTHGDGNMLPYSSLPLITTATNSTRLLATALSTAGITVWQNIFFSNTAGTNADAIWQPSVHCTGGSTWVFNHDKFSGFATAIDSADSTGDEVCNIAINGTEITGSTTIGVQNGGAAENFLISGSYFHGNAEDVETTSSAVLSVTLLNSIFAGSSGSNSVDILGSTSDLGTNTIQSCDFYGAAGGALGLVTNLSFTSVSNNVFYGNGYGITSGSSGGLGAATNIALAKNNAFGNNTNPNTNWPAMPSDITLTANPFVNASSGNFALNSTAGGGASLKAAAYPGTWGTTSTGYRDIGAVQSQGSSGGAANFGDSH